MKNPRSALCDWAGNILLGLCKCVILCEEVNAVTLTSYGNRRTMTSFLGFKKGNLDGTITLVDAPYRVYDNSIQYRRYMKKRAKDRLEAETA